MARLRLLTSIALGMLLVSGAPQAAPDAAQAEAADEAGQDSPGTPLPVQALTPELVQIALLGDIAAQRGNGVLAAQLWQELAKRTKDPRIARHATELAISSGQLQIAVDCAERWIAAAPDSKQARQIMIGLLLRANRIDDITPHLHALMIQSPDEVTTFFMQLHQLWNKGADRAAILRVTQHLAERYPQQAEAHFAVAVALSNSSQSTEALAELDKALALRPQWEPAMLYKAQLLAGKDPQASLAFLSGASKANPASISLQLAQARLLAEQNQIGEAYTAYQQIVRLQPDNLEALVGQAVTAMELRKLDEAQQLLERALGLKPGEPDIFYQYLGGISEEKRLWKDALGWYQQITAADIAARVQMRIPRLLARLGDEAGAMQALDRLPERSSDEQISKAQMTALVWRELKQPERARAVLNEAIVKFPASADLYYDRSIYLDELGDHAAAERDLRKNLELSPDNAPGQNALGYLLTNRTERFAEAQALLESALAQEADNPAYLDSMGWLRFKQERYPEAEQLLQRAWQAMPDPEIGLHLAQALAKLGRSTEARKIVDAVAAMEADHPELGKVRQLLGF
ncbi:tetratricopeptide repeat protein [Chitinilyticum litopenaei]|uniref:tetratricopeptide repeat protein n=1 Tax=Chitinilyticum litopenaei TaxID=1121276 RepID=UPI00042193AB|nr:tetratricopeptide repeat protein [Chitinilyticum litopenaei]